MYCPRCGKADQSPDTYCRACGQFLKEPASGAIAFGGRTSRENVNAINILSVIAALASLVVAVLLYLTRFNEPTILYLAAALLLCNAVWHVSNLIVGLKLRRRLVNSGQKPDEQTAMPPAETRELLPVGDPAAPLPLTITEDTTKDLKDKVRR
ncbi:MAG TPA: hypothetical protein VJV05_01160 [Pyrinomonadaceae bacterium]|nr:hypothetical protein [Pyrinomonadaceae bacterium]